MKKVQAHPSTSDSHGQVKRFREGREFVLEAEQWLPATPETIWRFVGDCRHMNLVIPAFMKFEILSAATDGTLPEILPGVQYEYRLKLHGISVFWRMLIKEVQHPVRFRDVQDKGPYARFSHEHRFDPEQGGTRTRDIIRYRPPGGPLAPLIDRVYVGPSLQKLFVCRHARLSELFANHADPSELFNTV